MRFKKKGQNIENQINLEIEKAQEEINDLKKDSIASIYKISEELTSKIIEEVIWRQIERIVVSKLWLMIPFRKEKLREIYDF